MNNIMAAASSATKKENVLKHNNDAHYVIQRRQYLQTIKTPTAELPVKKWHSNKNRDSSSVISRRSAAAAGYTKYNEVVNGNYYKTTDTTVAINEQRNALRRLRGNGGSHPYKSANLTTGTPFFWA